MQTTENIHQRPILISSFSALAPRAAQPDAAAGIAGGTCTPGVFPGTTTEYDEGIDIDQTKLSGGAPTGHGGVASIDPTRFVRDPANNCAPVYPWNFVRTYTIFGVVHAAGGYTAWSEKHPSYSAVNGPGKLRTQNRHHSVRGFECVLPSVCGYIRSGGQKK